MSAHAHTPSMQFKSSCQDKQQRLSPEEAAALAMPLELALLLRPMFLRSLLVFPRYPIGPLSLRLSSVVLSLLLLLQGQVQMARLLQMCSYCSVLARVPPLSFMSSCCKRFCCSLPLLLQSLHALRQCKRCWDCMPASSLPEMW